MRRGAILLVLAATAGCGSRPDASAGNSAGGRLEAAAVAAGLVVDPAARGIVGAWARDTDHACIVPGDGAEGRIGLLVDYGAGNGCAASGTVRRRGEALDIHIGACRVTARFEGARFVLPAEVPAACDRFCVGHATLAAMAVDQQSSSASEAASLRTPSGRLLCGD